MNTALVALGLIMGLEIADIIISFTIRRNLKKAERTIKDLINKNN